MSESSELPDRVTLLKDSNGNLIRPKCNLFSLLPWKKSKIVEIGENSELNGPQFRVIKPDGSSSSASPQNNPHFKNSSKRGGKIS